MLLDEPFAGVDPISVLTFRTSFATWTLAGSAFLITDHNVRENAWPDDRAYIIHEAKVLTHGRADDIVNNADVRRLYLGDKFHLWNARILHLDPALRLTKPLKKQFLGQVSLWPARNFTKTSASRGLVGEGSSAFIMALSASLLLRQSQSLVMTRS